MKELVWLRRESWEELQTLLKNIQIRKSPAVAKAAMHFTGTGSNSRIFLDLPENKPGYDGMFKVVYDCQERAFTVLDPFDPEKETAGFAYINGVYTEIPAESIDLNENVLADKEIMLPDGTTATVKEGYVSLCLDPEGGTSFTLTPEVVKRVYDGEFCVEYNRKKDLLAIVDGSNARGETAGYALINGVSTKIPSANLFLDANHLEAKTITLRDGTTAEVLEGYVSLCLDPNGRTFFALAPEASGRIYVGEFAVEYNRKEDVLVIVDGSNAKSSVAGNLLCNGVYTPMPSGKLPVEEGTLCIALDSDGKLSYKILANPFNRIYDGEFAVCYDPKNNLVDVLDGTTGSIGTAGHAFLDGEWNALAGASLVPENGYLCLRYGEEGASYAIVEKPQIPLVKWAEKPPEEEEEGGEE